MSPIKRRFAPPWTDQLYQNDGVPEPMVQVITEEQGGGGSGVASFNTRTGAVTSQSGDYTAAQVGALSTAAGTINALTDKPAPVGGDQVLIEDSAAGFAQKKASLTNIIALASGAVTSVFGRTGAVVAVAGDYTAADVSAVASVAGTINALTGKTTPVSADVLLLEDSAAGFAQKKVSVSDLLAVVAPTYIHDEPGIAFPGPVAYQNISIPHNLGKYPLRIDVYALKASGEYKIIDNLFVDGGVGYGWSASDYYTGVQNTINTYNVAIRNLNESVLPNPVTVRVILTFAP